MNRKHMLRAALGGQGLRDQAARELPSGNGEPAPAEPAVAPPGAERMPAPPERSRTLVRSGAVGAMGRSLERLAHAAEEARALVAAGDRVVELDPELVERSFVADRLDPGGGDHAALVASIRERGQQVPILVRPHPLQPNRYQVAYGHRRLRAAAEIGRPVRAVVRPLTDEELVVAQGQENSARTDLSYIERALFAVALEDRGFERSVIMAALSLEKTQLSRLISIGRAIPGAVAAAIGPAPKAGRPRWQALADALGGEGARALAERTSSDPAFRALDSDGRFAHLLRALTAPTRTRARPSLWRDASGRALVRIERTARHVQLTVDEWAEPAFAAYLVESLPGLHAAFLARKAGRDGT